MSQSYTAQDIEVLSGLEPVRRRRACTPTPAGPTTSRTKSSTTASTRRSPAIAAQIDVTVYKDGSLEVVDDGRGMPVDIHPKEKVSGVELILTRLHAGGKFSDDSGYKFSGGLHGVGVSVVNALSKHLECWVRRGGKEYNIAFKNGKVHSKLEGGRHVGKSNTGTTVRFWPDTSYFDAPRFRAAAAQARAQGQGRAVPGPARALRAREDRREGGVALHRGAVAVPASSRSRRPNGCRTSRSSARSRASTKASTGPWSGVPDGGTRFDESYVNLIPTAQGGTHVNGLRLGLTEAVREFCEFRNLLPRGLKLAPEDVWDDSQLRALDEDARSAVRGPDQGAAVVARVRGVRLRHRQGRSSACG